MYGSVRRPSVFLPCYEDCLGGWEHSLWEVESTHWKHSSSSSATHLVLSFVAFTASYQECSSSSSAFYLFLSFVAFTASCWEHSSSSLAFQLVLSMTVLAATCGKHSSSSSDSLPCSTGSQSLRVIFFTWLNLIVWCHTLNHRERQMELFTTLRSSK